MEFQKLFTPITIGSMELKNRIVMLPISTGYDEADSTVGDRFIDFFATRAKGGAALIDMPFTPINDGHLEPGLYDDRFLPGIRNLTSRIHAYGAKAAAQLIITYFIDFKGGAPEVVGPSPVLNKIMHCVPRELTIEEIKIVVSEFGKAARRAREGGFDAVEILVGGGYLLNRFLSPISNERKDQYGGNLENRTRIILEIVESIKKEAGRDFPVICRLNVEEQMPGGHTIEDSKEVLKALERGGVDMINTYTGWHESPVPTVAPSVPKGAFVYLSQKIKEYVGLPVIAANRINDPYMAEEILRDGKADLIGMCRPLVADPEFPNKAREGRVDEITPCLACTECLAQMMAAGYGGGDRDSMPKGSLCSVNPLAGRENKFPKKTSPRKKVFVVGSGPGGMTAAMESAFGGHDVTVIEQAGQPGGRLLTAAIPPFKEEISNLIQSMYVRAQKAGVAFRFDTKAVPEFLEKEKPDVLILAMGADPLLLPIPGIDKPNVLMAEDVLTGRKKVKGSVIVVGGGMVGCETAEFIKVQGTSDVTVLEMLGRLADNVVPTYRPFFLARLKKDGIKLEANTTVTEITDTGVRVNRKGEEGFIPGDTVVLAAGFKADPAKIEVFKTMAPEVFIVGDCAKARNIRDAVEEGFEAGCNI